jgi:tetratricopeptide (TPR) repeat protein/predicted Ser/Thr protein kinase
MIGTTLQDRYRLNAELGHGGIGTVYLAHDSTLDRSVAVKLLQGTALGTEGRARLLREAQATAKLNHPNVVSVYDAGESDGAPFIVMELVEGSTLHERQPQTNDKIIDIAIQICRALEHAHEHDIVHRDLKPENVLIAKDGTVKLVDFGLARSIASRMTSEGRIEGTVFYLAPEQALGRAVDGRTDLYALGVMLYELVSCCLPFTADDPLAVISQHIHAPVIPPRARDAEIPPAFDDLIVQLLSKQPEDRPGSAVEVRRRLEIVTDDGVGDPLAEFSLLDRIVRGRMVGRESEFTEAMEHWKRAAQGDGHVLLISGEPGIGKTRLARELCAQARVTGAAVYTGEAYAEGGAPYASIGQIIREMIGQDDDQPLELPEFILADLLTIAPDLRLRYPDISQNPSLDQESEQQRIYENFVAFCGILAEQAPLLLFVDDVHWAGSGSLKILRHLARRGRNLPLLIVLTYREVELDESRPLQNLLYDLNRERLAARLKIPRLSREKTRDMLTAMFTEEISPDFLDGIYLETDGNPFFIEEVCKALIEEGKLYVEDGRWHRPDMNELEVPQSVRVAIQSRVKKLPEFAQETLRLGAILGNEFEYELLQSASDLDEETLINALEAAERVQLVREVRENGNVNFAFMHALIPTTLRESLSGLRRQRYHHRVAETLESARPQDFESLAYHHDQAGHSNRARVYYLQAGDRARNTFAPEDAVRYFQAALEYWPEEDKKGRADLLIKLGGSLGAIGETSEQFEAFNSAKILYEGLDDVSNLSQTERRLGENRWWVGDRAESMEHYHRALSILEDGPETEDLAWAISEISRMYMLASEYGRAIEWGDRAIALAERLQADDVKVHAYNNTGTSRVHIGEQERGLQELQESLRLAHVQGAAGNIVRAYYNFSELLMNLGRYDEAREILNTYWEFVLQFHSRFYEGAACYHLVNLDWMTGRWSEALANRSTIQELRIGLHRLWSLRTQAGMEYDLGRPGEMLEELEESLDIALQSGEIQTSVPYLGQLLRAYVALGNQAKASSSVEKILELIDQAPYFESNCVMTLFYVSQWFLLKGDADALMEGRGCLERLEKVHGQINTPESEASLEEASGALALQEKDHSSAVKRYERARELWQKLGRPFDEARALASLGQAQVNTGALEAAREAFDDASQLLDALSEQLDDEQKASFLDSELVTAVREARSGLA